MESAPEEIEHQRGAPGSDDRRRMEAAAVVMHLVFLLLQRAFALECPRLSACTIPGVSTPGIRGTALAGGRESCRAGREKCA
jgi:hypothetical protein